MIFLIVLFLFFLGLAVGSFLNVAIERSERGEVLTGRSHCDICDKILSWKELIPVISFLYQKRRCIHCGAALSMQYILMELGTGVVFIIIGYVIFSSVLLMNTIFSLLILSVFLIVASAMIVVVVADLKYHIIPNGSVLVLALVGVGVTLARNGFICVPEITSCISASLYGAVGEVVASIGGVLFLFGIWYFSKGRAMGFGDVKLIGATSLLIGFPLSLVALLFSFWLGGIWGIVLLIAKMRNLKSQIAFGPFIIAGTLLAFLCGEQFLISSGFYYLL